MQVALLAKPRLEQDFWLDDLSVSNPFLRHLASIGIFSTPRLNLIAYNCNFLRFSSVRPMNRMPCPETLGAASWLAKQACSLAFKVINLHLHLPGVCLPSFAFYISASFL